MYKYQEMDKIMQERIEKFNQWIMNIDIKRIPVGLYPKLNHQVITMYQVIH